MRVAHLLRKLDPAEWSGTEMAIQRLFDGLRVSDSFLLQNNLREILFRKPNYETR